MKQIKTAAARATMIAALSMAAAAAHAVPIVFDFTGTVTDSTIYTNTGTTSDDSLNGQTVSGRITLQTDGLLPPLTTSNAAGTTIGHRDSTLDAMDWITSELSIGGVSYDMSLYPNSGGYILGFDSSGVAPCSGCAPTRDFLALLDISQQQWWDVPAGVYHRRQLALSWSDGANPLSLVDLSNGFDPLAWLPLMNSLLPSGSYYDMTVDCANNECGTISESVTGFSISSITVSAVNVPEPGTLALFTLGLAGAALGRRGLAQ